VVSTRERRTKSSGVSLILNCRRRIEAYESLNDLASAKHFEYLWQVRPRVPGRIPLAKKIGLRVSARPSPTDQMPAGALIPRRRDRQHGVDAAPQVILGLVDQGLRRVAAIVAESL
jgi:hypothetical protein